MLRCQGHFRPWLAQCSGTLGSREKPGKALFETSYAHLCGCVHSSSPLILCRVQRGPPARIHESGGCCVSLYWPCSVTLGVHPVPVETTPSLEHMGQAAHPPWLSVGSAPWQLTLTLGCLVTMVKLPMTVAFGGTIRLCGGRGVRPKLGELNLTAQGRTRHHAS